ncbi:MAG TPA: phosphate signaling complex protein PhoU [Ignavibacteria bacterium]|nr:phosphate signaling complex protein PhoU [Ignavibacteria bacterium]
MLRQFENELEELKTNILKMASLVDEQVENSFNDMENAEIRMHDIVKAQDKEVDAYDNLIMAQCENFLALYQPVATDLRFILTAIRIDSQLERCGDIAVNIVQRVKKTEKFRHLLSETKLFEMGKTVRTMVKDAITAFINNDTKLAKEVMLRDDEVDKYNKNVFKELISKMQNDPSVIKPCAHLIVLTRHMERLADHATNIAEDVIFLVDAEIVSHQKKLKDYKFPDR